MHFSVNIELNLIWGHNFRVYPKFLYFYVNPTILSLTSPQNKTLLDLQLDKNW